MNVSKIRSLCVISSRRRGAPALPLPMEYGVDIGSAVSIQALRARWAGIRSAHPQLFEGLAPTIFAGRHLTLD